MTVHHTILARQCWIFDLDGSLTIYELADRTADAPGAGPLLKGKKE